MSAGLFPRVLALPLAVLLLIFLPAAVPVHAADDSNAGQLTQVPTLTPQQLGSAIATLEQGSSNPQVQGLLSQFQSQLNSGNYTGAQATLSTLQGLSSSNPGSVTPTLNALLQSLSVGSDGASVNANTLSSLTGQLGSASSTGESAQQISTGLASLANLMQYANSTLASELLQNSSLFSQSAFTGSGGALGTAPVTLPGVSGFSGVSVPSIGAPTLSVGGLGKGAPNIPFDAFAIPLLGAAIVVGAYLARGRIARVARATGSQRLPGISLARAVQEQAGPIPSDPRARIEYYFGRAVNLMARRGVPKLGHETHREFSAKCEAEPEKPQVSTLSDLYEKAKFSGQDVEGSDASLASSSYLAMEKLER